MKKKQISLPIQNILSIPVVEQNRSATLAGNIALKLVQVVQNAHLGMMFKGYSEFLATHSMKFRDLHPGCGILFLNRKRNYMKLVIGNETDHPVILAYRFPSESMVTAAALKEVVRSLGVKRGDVKAMDARLDAVLRQTKREADAKPVN